MIERVEEKAVNVEGVTARQPLNFQLYYAGNDGRATIINTLYLEDGNPKLDLYLIVFNESSGNITFKAPPPAKLSQVGGSDSASAEKCHFSLRLEKDIQIRPSEISVESNEWQVNYSENDQFITIYFLSKKELVLQRKAPDNDSDTVRLTLKNLAAYNGSIKSSNVELTYGSSLLLNSKGQEVSPISSKNAISVTNHPDHRDIPLQFRFIGPNSILNDGTTENSLKLQIINRPPSNNTRPNLLLDKANSKFLVSFEIGTGAEALTTEERVKAIKLTTTNTTKWKAVKPQNATEGTVNLQDNTQPINQKLGSGEAIELEIKDIKTNNPSGVSYMYIAYQNIVGYPDGRLVVPIEKTPLLYRGTNGARVGIGTNNPEAKLHVSGGNAIIGGKLAIGSTNPLIDLAIGDNDTGLKQVGENKLAIYTNNLERVRIEENGNVGIGTPSPKIHLAIGDDDTGLKQQGDGKLAIYTNDGERVRIDEYGRVGIGTTTPSALLDVNGSVKLGHESTAWNRIICGKVIIDYNNISNSRVFGKGISCARYQPPGYPSGSSPVTGLFKITFEKSVIPEKLVVIVTPQDKHTDNIVNVESVVYDGFTIQVKDSKERTVENSSFHFIAIELTENINKLVTTYTY